MSDRKPSAARRAPSGTSQVGRIITPHEAAALVALRAELEAAQVPPKNVSGKRNVPRKNVSRREETE